MYTIATLEQLRGHLGAPPNATEDARLLRALEAASTQIERLTGRRFLPYVAARQYDLPPSDALLLDEDLLAIDALHNGDGSAIDLADVVLMPSSPPHSVLRLRDGAYYLAAAGAVAAITVNGVWGWHERYTRAWVASGESLAAPLDEAATALPVSAISGVAADGQSPRFQVGALLRLDDEFLRVLALDEAAQTLTLERGAQGSTAAAHSVGALLEVFRPDAEALSLSLRWAAWLYRQPDSGQNDLSLALLEALYGLRRVGVKA